MLRANQRVDIEGEEIDAAADWLHQRAFGSDDTNASP